MLETPTLNLLERALDYASTRQEVLSNNISNANTPGYRRKEASFDDILAMAQGGAAARVSQINQTTRKMFAGGLQGKTGFDIVETGEGSMRVDGNNVDMDAEMSRLAQNQIYYETITQITGGQFSALKGVIKGQ
ncbi:MAG TPA: flagellar basal body rod protein FlgB [Capsulimonadaceae bacterium]|jgi:flagellar basal-body rod protein FlgB